MTRAEKPGATDRFWFGIRARLFFLVLVATVPLLMVVAYTTWVMRDVQDAEMRADLEYLARSASDQLKWAAENGEQLLKALSQVPAVARGDPAECKRIFADILGKSKRYAAFFVMDAKGQVLYHSAGLSEPINLADRAYFQRVRATKRFSTGDVVVSRVSRKPVMTLAYPLLDGAGEFRGVIATGLDLKWFGERFDRSRPDLNLIFALWDEDATILYRYPDHEKWVGKRVADTESTPPRNQVAPT
jgi:C4-dicarboxylate-specific signal transduction histidine kinase